MVQEITDAYLQDMKTIRQYNERFPKTREEILNGKQERYCVNENGFTKDIEEAID